MAIFTEDFRNRSIQLVEKYVEESCLHDDLDIVDWIEANRKSHIIEFILDETQWQEILIHKNLTKEQINTASDCIYRSNGKQLNAFNVVRDEILFNFWCDDVLFLRDEIQQVLDNQDDAEDTRFADDARERTYDMNEEF
jgi:hypothetical protein